MNVLLDGQPDRKIERLYAAICVDPQTGLEGISGMSAGGQQMQAVSSNRSVIEKMCHVIAQEPWATKFQFKIVEFVRK